MPEPKQIQLSILSNFDLSKTITRENIQHLNVGQLANAIIAEYAILFTNNPYRQQCLQRKNIIFMELASRFKIIKIEDNDGTFMVFAFDKKITNSQVKQLYKVTDYVSSRKFKILDVGVEEGRYDLENDELMLYDDYAEDYGSTFDMTFDNGRVAIEGDVRLFGIDSHFVNRSLCNYLR